MLYCDPEGKPKSSLPYVAFSLCFTTATEMENTKHAIIAGYCWGTWSFWSLKETKATFCPSLTSPLTNSLAKEHFCFWVETLLISGYIPFQHDAWYSEKNYEIHKNKVLLLRNKPINDTKVDLDTTIKRSLLITIINNILKNSLIENMDQI